MKNKSMYKVITTKINKRSKGLTEVSKRQQILILKKEKLFLTIPDSKLNIP